MFLLHGESMVKSLCSKGVGHFECKFQGERGIAHQQLLVSEN